MKRKYLFTVGVLAVALAFTFTLTACPDGDDGGSGGNTDPKKLAITGITQQVFANAEGWWLLGVFQTGTTQDEVLEAAIAYISEENPGSKIVAGASGDDIVNITPSAPYSMTVQLKSAPYFTGNWTGTGTYDIWFFSLDDNFINYYIYKMPNVSITGASTTVAAKTTPDASGPIFDDDDITYTVAATGSPNTTAISFTFSAAVTGLTATDITITSGTGSATKGSLTGSGTSWSLGVTAGTAGTVTVKISKTGIESGNKTVTITKSGGSGDVIPADLHGTWNWTSGGHSIKSVVSGTALQITEAGGTAANNGIFTLTVSNITPVTNTGANSATFPSGYTLTGTITSSTVTSKPSGTPNVSFTVYLNAAMTQFFETGDSRTFTRAGDGTNLFAGTSWTYSNEFFQEYDFTMTFTATTYTATYPNDMSVPNWTDAYTYNGNMAILMSGSTVVATATLSGNELTVIWVGSEEWPSIMTKN